MYIIFCFIVFFFCSYLFSCFLLNHPYDLNYSVQYFSSFDSSLVRFLFDSFDENNLIDSLDLQKNEINIEMVVDNIISDSIELKKNVILSIFILYDLSLVKQMSFYAHLLNTCINDIFFLYDYFDVEISNELVRNINSSLYLIEEYMHSLDLLLIVLKNIDGPYISSELYIENFISEVIKE